VPVTPTWAQRDRARRLVAEGHEAAIVGDYTTARDRFQEAARLDPTSAVIADSLARAYERTKEMAAAAREYCRYLALSPDSSEAGDVRSRIAALTPRQGLPVLADRASVGTSAAEPRQQALDPSVAFTRGLLPGIGQFYTHRPALGLAVMGAVVGATYWGIHSEQATHMRSYTDPNGYTFQYPVTARERPHLAAGIATASAITLLGALEAYLYARRDAGASPAAAGTAPPAQARSVRAAPMIAPGGVGMRLTVRVPFSIR
jgi:tetratricopeptide (TPR) repeat protein